jgi:hypothetical protein
LYPSSFDNAKSAASALPLITPKCAVNMPGLGVAPSPDT